MPPRPPAPLARHYLVWLAALTLALGGVIVGSALQFVLWPMAQRSADDLAGLMVLAAQTWSELPPETRPAFEEELALRHRLALRPDFAPPPPGTELVHGFYIGFLEDALQRRTGQPASLQLLPAPGDRASAPGAAITDHPAAPWLWTRIPTAGRQIGVGFDTTRLDTHPLQALGSILALGSALAIGLALWLARRIAQPVAQLEQAAAALAAGSGPQRLPETGPAELARLARHFNHMATQVRELLEARTTLLAGVSHDLRTPLARMRLALEMLRLQPDERLIHRLEQDIQAMDALIGQMLDLARGLDREAAEPIDVAAWLALRAEAHREAAAVAGAHIEVDCEAGLGVQAAPGALARVIDNLLGNALRYAPGEITLQGQRLPGGDTVRLSVADRGPGIAAEHLPVVWRPFQRLEASRSPQTGGWGLGLAVVRQLAAIHGWHVELQGREGGGLEAVVDLPPLEGRPHSQDEGGCAPPS
ncbi:sensor histidine kinase [Sphaerotilus microaerophilus]|uniref:sensor histidine kinase n=1 Tax=Sphaerotilus microaerophilus TaxID=2914710 RepID=UPI0020744682|nr:ATP-binding protein [Sphaerotilus sp. FB-5]